MHRLHSRTHRFGRLLVANFYDLRLLLRDSRFSLLGFSALSAIGTLYLLFGYNDYPHSGVDKFTPLSALFETLRMLVLQSGLPLPRSDRLGHLVFFLLPLLGLALVFQSVMNFGRYLFDKGSRREAWQVALASTYRNHVIVCGLGRVGYRAMRQLVDTGYEVVVIERDWNSEFVGPTLALGVPVVLGDARQNTILCQAGLRRASGLLAAISNDLLNLEVALTAREQQPTLNVVLRIFDDAIDSNIERCFGRNATFSSSALAAPTLAAAAVTRDIAHVLIQGDQLIGIAEINVQPDSQITGPVRALEERLDVRVLHHTRGDQLVAPTDPLNRGDCVTLLGSLQALEQLRLHNQASGKLGVLTGDTFQAPATHCDTVIVCGLGKVGFRVIMQLSQLPHRPQIVLITAHNTRDQFLKIVEGLGVRIVVGDARVPEVLREAGIDHAYSVAAVTGHDLLNIEISLAARQQREDIHVVLRVFSEVMAERLDVLFGLHTAYSAAGLAAPALAAGSVLRGLSNAVRVGDQLFAQIDLTVQPDSLLAGRTVTQLRAGENALVIAIQRDGRALAPQLDTSLHSGDEVALLAPLPVLARLQTNALRLAPASAPQVRSETEEMVLR